MSKRVTFVDICNRLAAANCVASGQSIQQIATSAKRSPATIRRWLKDVPLSLKRPRLSS
jgi:predicted transcriptional regulator